VASDSDVSRRQETYDDALDEPLAICAHVLYSAVATLLAKHGAVTLDYDGHREFISHHQSRSPLPITSA
jgi:hypothetical protein